MTEKVHGTKTPTVVAVPGQHFARFVSGYGVQEDTLRGNKDHASEAKKMRDKQVKNQANNRTGLWED